MAHYKLTAQIDLNNATVAPANPITIARYSDVSLLGLTSAEAHRLSDALIDPTTAQPTIANSVYLPNDGQLTINHLDGFLQWTGTQWVDAPLPWPTTLGGIYDVLSAGDTLHWFIYV